MSFTTSLPKNVLPSSKRRFIYDHLGALGLHSLHHSLDGALAEIVGIALHSQAVDAYHNFLFLTCGVVILSRIAVISSHFQHLVGYEILTGPVALHYSRHHVLWNIGVICEQLFGVLGKAVASISERRVVVMQSDARVETDAVDNVACVKSPSLRRMCRVR